jgi:hypothetical protein
MKMKPNYKKSLKLLTLLITSVIIATVAADTYYELFMYGSGITITDNRVILVAGTDTPTISTNGVENSGTTVTFDKITIAKGEMLTYDETVKIQNNAGETRNIVLDVTSLTGPFSANFEYVYITVYDGATQKGEQIKMLPSGSNITTTGSISMPNSAIWTVQWIIKAKVDATPNDQISLTVKVTVQ